MRISLSQSSSRPLLCWPLTRSRTLRPRCPDVGATFSPFHYHMMMGVAPDERLGEVRSPPGATSSEVIRPTVRPSENPIRTRDIPHFALISPIHAHFLPIDAYPYLPLSLA